MKKLLKLASLTLITVTFSSCAILNPQQAPKPIDYLNNGLKMNIKKFFDGKVEAFAIKKDRNGKIIGTATININASWEKNKGVIKQNFSYNNGKKDSRTWLITLENDGTFNAVGHDVASPARGKQVGNAAQSIYSLMLNTSDGKKEILFEDRMYLVNDNSMITISNFRRKNANKENPKSSGKYVISLKKVKETKKQKSTTKKESKTDSVESSEALPYI